MLSQNSDILIRSVQYGDWEVVEQFCNQASADDGLSYAINPTSHLKPYRPWYGPLKVLGALFKRPNVFGAYLAERDSKLQGVIQVSPFNRARSTWRVDRVALVNEIAADSELPKGETAMSLSSDLSESPTVVKTPSFLHIGSLLLRHCFEKTWEARNWLLEVNVNDTELLALYRHNGFQPLAQMTYWEISPEELQELAEREPDLPNLLPVSNADAQLLYQLDTMSMPPLLRQVFDRHVEDFKTSLVGSLCQGIKNWLNHTEVISGYVFESQRKAAIGYFQVQLCRNGSRPHQAQLTVNPAYTWLYPELMSQMARITQDFPESPLQLVSSDYHKEREEYLERLGASRIAHTLMMSRSVWHKVRESKLSLDLQLPEVFQGLKPARKPIPSRISLIQPHHPAKFKPPTRNAKSASKPGGINKSVLDLAGKDFPDSPPEGPCC
ncbi:GNAT family N-acetyltransferase [Leptodesmis sp.]|uniref:GNAT family N-acetyltransferase n=1 Tax=Leptodesmis sp. TaxID=3100501 RepID=UPI0040534ADA